MKRSTLDALTVKRGQAITRLKRAQRRHQGQRLAAGALAKLTTTLLRAELEAARQRPRHAGRFTRPDAAPDHPTLL